MRIFLDDIRMPPEGRFDLIIVRTADEAIRLLDTNKVTYVTFDHDLGHNVPTGYDVAKHIEKQCYFGAMKCPDWDIHSANPVGRENIQWAMIAAETFSKPRN